MQVIYKFTHDGSKLLQTTARRKWLGRTHAFQPPDLHRLAADGTFFGRRLRARACEIQ
jgi:hypothetical protein